ncbi:MAG: SDR family NAD(P)-dependent oxidoreductase [Pseudomonadota bacterium]
MAASDWHVDATGREARAGVVALDDPAVPDLIGRATYILSSTPPSEGADPVLSRYEKALSAGTAQLIYLSSTGVYGDAAGAWVDETAPTGEGRRQARSAADAGWQALGAAVLRLPGIYGPGRSPFARLRDGTATRIDAPGQVFSRIHVDDIAAAIAAVIATGATGIFNIADDRPAPAADVTAFAARLAGIDPPPLVPLAEADLSPMARGFYTENRRVANGKMKRDLGLALRYPDYRAGLRAVWEEEKRA